MWYVPSRARMRRVPAYGSPVGDFEIILVDIGKTRAERVIALRRGGSIGDIAAFYQTGAPRVRVANALELLFQALHATLGVLVPRALASRDPERVGGWVAGPVLLLARLLRPAAVLVDALARGVLRLAGLRDATEADPGEELRELVGQARIRGLLHESDSAMLAGLMDFHAKKARDVMRPRTEIAALEIDASGEEVWDTLRTERYSRYPVYRESLDDIR